MTKNLQPIPNTYFPIFLLLFFFSTVGITTTFGQFTSCPNNNDTPPPYLTANGNDANYSATLDISLATLGPGEDFCIGNDPGKDTEGGCGTFRFTGLDDSEANCGTKFCFSPRQGCGEALGNVCIYQEDQSNLGSWEQLGSFDKEAFSELCVYAPPGVTSFSVTICRPGNGPVSINDVNVTPPPSLTPIADQNVCAAELSTPIDLTALESNGQAGGTWTKTGTGATAISSPSTFQLSGEIGDVCTLTYTYDATSEIGNTCLVTTTVQYTITEDCCIPPAEPTGLNCWQSATFDEDICDWIIIGTQKPEPTNLNCWESASFDTSTCEWVVTGEQSREPAMECYQSASWDNTNCEWVVSGEQPLQPSMECYQSATWEDAGCLWVVTGDQPQRPTLECWQTATFNINTCSWDVTGEEPRIEQTTYCTFTQGFYGNAGGKFDGLTTTEIISNALQQGPIVIGQAGNSLTLNTATCILTVLPGGGPVAALPNGDIVVNATCDPAPIATKQNGTIRNVLATQTITLTINTRYDGGLSSLGLANVCFDIAPAVLAALPATPTIGDLLNYANAVLAGTDPQNQSAVNAAVSGINEVFDECGTACNLTITTFDDRDGDGVCDNQDICDGGDDTIDSDGDGTPDHCDTTCADADGDGVCDDQDICDGGDDTIDSDGDGTPDHCDTACADADGDGICDDEDCAPNDATIPNQIACNTAPTPYCEIETVALECYSATLTINYDATTEETTYNWKATTIANCSALSHILFELPADATLIDAQSGGNYNVEFRGQSVDSNLNGIKFEALGEGLKSIGSMETFTYVIAGAPMAQITLQIKSGQIITTNTIILCDDISSTELEEETVATSCPTPTDIVVENVSKKKRKITWTTVSEAKNYELRIRVKGTTEWIIVKNARKNSVTMSGPMDLYEFQVRTNCGDGDYSPYSAITDFNITGNLRGATSRSTSTDNVDIILPIVHSTTMEIKIFPNPVSSVLTIQYTTATEAMLIIRHISGQLVSQQQLATSNTQHQLDVSTLTTGIYTISIQVAGQQPIVRKFVKTAIE